jgi:type II secretory ATPase GspE/PulE/Tfp pilus assembly ATPase PilB-like protein
MEQQPNSPQQNFSRTSVQPALDALGEQNASNVFEIVMAAAVALSASDVHIDGVVDGGRVRMRIDGILYDIATLNEHMERLILSRVKLLSGLKLNISKTPQDGNFSLPQQDRTIEVRVSTLPSDFGEDIAMRLLDPASLLPMDRLGVREDLRVPLEQALKKPLGLTLITGPTGSGKTTTLYAALSWLLNESVKIITIEDPIEYRLEGISQSQVNEDADYSFESGLKAILRQDPDIVMLSELRDRDSADAALQASLAGRRVLSTIHTNDAAGAIPRLIDMGANAEAIASGLSAVIAQRLLRRLCESCKTQRAVTQEEKLVLENIWGSIPEVARQGASLPETVFDAGRGCASCSETGYKGRIGVFELFLNDDELEKIIMDRPAEEELRERLIARGMTTMHHDALLRVAQGVTSLAEIERVLGAFGSPSSPKSEGTHTEATP